MITATHHLRDEALLMLDGRGAILDVARRISSILQSAKIDGAIIGGVAVVLHGHVRTTLDVDVFVPGSLDDLAAHLQSAGFIFDRALREFRFDDVPVHLVTPDQTELLPRSLVVIDDVRTVTLADLISLKLHSGCKSVLRSQDLADVIGLMRIHKLDGSFTPKIDKRLRKEFKQLLKAIERGK